MVRVRSVSLLGGVFVTLAMSLAAGATATTTTDATATTSTSSPTSPSTTSTTSPTVTLSAVGDMELGNAGRLPPNPSSYLSPVRRVLAAPIVFGNLEGTITNATTSKCAPTSSQCYAFKVPVAYAAIYRQAGFTVLNSANNHAFDYGAAGALDTSRALAAAGITQAGLPGQIGLVRENGVRVAFVDFAPYYNTNNFLDLAQVAQLLARAKREASVVVVYLHAGAEGSSADHVTRASETYVGENRGNPYAVAHFAVDHGADLVLASGPHVLRGLQWYRGRLIDYSLGDFANYWDFSASGPLALSAILHVTLGADGAFVSGAFTSIRLQVDGQAFVDPTRASATFVNELSRQDFGASAALVAPSGTILGPRA